MSANKAVLSDFEQGSMEWLSLRKTKITATDACVIMGASPWKNVLQLYNEKIAQEPVVTYKNSYMQRGLDLEPVARDLFFVKTRHKMVPKVFVKDWAMASLDGINDWDEILEIKCPGKKDHDIALRGKIPDHYYPQLQHQMYVCDSERAFYFSFDGFDGVTVEVERDDEYIKKMVEKELVFYQSIINKTPPEDDEKQYVEIQDPEWETLASLYKEATSNIKGFQKMIEELESQQEYYKNQILSMSKHVNSRGHGISISKIQRKGAVEYSKIAELKNVDLDKYRKPNSEYWKITEL